VEILYYGNLDLSTTILVVHKPDRTATMELKPSKMESWKDTFLIVAGLGALAIGLAANYQLQTALIWSTALTICASLAALHARWGIWFTRRLAILGSVVTLVACVIWQYNIPELEKPKSPPPDLSGRVSPSNDERPPFSETSEEVTITVGGSSLRFSIGALEGKRIPFPLAFGVSESSDYSPIYVGLRGGKPMVDVTVWAGHDKPAVEVKENRFTVRPRDWDSNTSQTALEIVNEKGVPVLQVYYKNPYRISISGTFAVPGGWLYATESSLLINPSPDPPPLKPIFRYPSWKYPGEYAKT
jgi:hypothetical protein